MKLLISILFFINFIYSYSYNYLNNDKLSYNVVQMNLDHPWKTALWLWVAHMRIKYNASDESGPALEGGFIFMCY